MGKHKKKASKKVKRDIDPTKFDLSWLKEGAMCWIGVDH